MLIPEVMLVYSETIYVKNNMTKSSYFFSIDFFAHTIIDTCVKPALVLKQLPCSPSPRSYFKYSYPKLVLFYLVLTFLLIAITNSSIRNPGPRPHENNSSNSDTLNIYYQNVQGLIPFSELDKKHPNLDQTKILELQSYIYENNPDAIVLNETWLKNSILDEEIIPSNEYKIYRWDRTEFSHPPDPNNRLRYRRNGGGVLIAINSSLLISSNYIDLKCQAEILAVELVMNDGSKVVISTCYRVGTLGTENCYEITSALNKLLRKKKLKKFFLIGDLNLRMVNWEENCRSNSVEQMFVDEFVRLGLI